MMDLFYELIQIAIGNRARLSRVLSEEEWVELFEEFKKQAMVGIGFNGVTRLITCAETEKHKGAVTCIGMSNELFFRWKMMMISVVQRNMKVDAVCAKVTKKFQEKGFQPIVLKGQANRIYYRCFSDHAETDTGSDISLLRTSGDIDLWVDSDRVRVIEAVRPQLKSIEARIHHVEYPSVDGIPVEVHYCPMFMYSFRAQRKFEKWCREERKYNVSVDENCGFASPEPYFNIVFQMVHILRHLLEEGIGMRQLLDMYMNLQANFDMTYAKKRKMSRKQLMRVLEDLGMERFVGAVMYVLWRVFEVNLTGETFFDWKTRWPWMICKPNRKRGELLQSEVMRAGNFGMYDKTKGEWYKKGKAQMFLWKLRRNWNIVSLCPEEVISGPFFRIWHYCWRWKNGYLGAIE